MQAPDLRLRLSNDLVTLIPLSANDFESLYHIAADPLIWEQHPSKDRYKGEVFSEYFSSAVDSNAAFLVYDNKTGGLIGCTRYYDHNPDSSSIAIGFTFLSRNCWGGIYNFAMKKLLLDHAFTFANTVIFHIGAGNIRSQKGTMKLGAVKVNEASNETQFEFALNKAEWVKRSEQLPSFYPSL